MRAFFCRAYGGPEVLELREAETPSPKDDEILVKIVATTVNSGDVRIRGARFPKGMGLIGKLALGISAPRQPVLGTELCGIVVAVGSKVTRFREGDEVFAFPGVKLGCHAEYRTLQENQRVFAKPKNLSFAEAASISFGGSTALHFIRKANLRAGEKILVIGASGAVGSAIVQIANHLGAEVTAVTSTDNVELVRSLGALNVIDYRHENFAANGETYDVIAETTGEHTFGGCRNSLKRGGRFLAIAADISDMLAMIWSSALYGKRVIAGPAEESVEIVKQIGEWAEAGILKPVIDRHYRFDQLPEAHAYVDTGRKKGSVIVEIAP
jgi:NADPH:quinone reductase-like Zn-dependent oxidoreductase